jgi:MFS transporter, DHA1 family, multidrug resistance protein
VNRTWTIVLLGSLAAFGPLSIDMYLPALPQLSDELHVGASTAQLTLTACLAGLAVGQLVSGPLSDRFGRRPPLLTGLVVYVVASLLCAVAPNAEVLIGLRFVQGAAAATGIALSRAIARDLHDGDELARFFSALLLVNGVAPILAPVVGAQLLRFASWRGVFYALAGIGAVLVVAVAVGLRETLPRSKRTAGGFAPVRLAMAELVRDRAFVGYLTVLGLSFGAMFAYIAGSSFVVETVHNGSPQLYSAIFAINGTGIVVASLANGRLLARFGPRRLLAAGVASSACGGFALLAVVAAGIGLAGIVPALFLLVASLGFILPNATALALADHPTVAGTASGLIGVFTFTVGAIAAPLVGIAGTKSAYPMAIVIAILSGASLLAVRRVRHLQYA